MDPSGRDKVGQLLAEAQSVPPDKRAAFLRDRCEEEALREEVASLLVALEEASDFYEVLADTVVAPMLREVHVADTEETGPKDSDPLGLEGTTVGKYAVEKHLGGGGMGIVYRARDPELERAVALKFLPPYLTASEEARERFLREARSAAALDHPHVATVHEIGRAEVGKAQGQRYIAMAYYEGETLKEMLASKGPLPVSEALDYATQTAEALSTAHEAGVVHRDVKPANVMVTENGEVKLLDFGIARAAAETELTETGRQPGTAAYMSPEQARGKEVDPRTDLWALGALLYEMLTGERPFQGKRHAAVLHAVLYEEPAPVTERRPEVPAALARVVHRCLEKDPAHRHASAEVLSEDLRALRAGEVPAVQESPSIPISRSLSGRLQWAISLVGILLAIGLSALGWSIWPSDEAPTASGRSVAVLPFEVSGSGAETWRDGMVTALSLNLDGVAGLRAISDRTLFAAWERRSSLDEEIGEENVLAVARDVGAKYAVVGSAVQLGPVLQLGAEVRSTATGEQLGKVDVRGKPDSITVLTDRLTRQILEVLLQRGEETLPPVNLSSITTSSLPAFKEFLEGERHFREGDYGGAAHHFEQATEEDTSFALAYARLGRSLGWSGQEGKVQALRRACEFDDHLPVRDRRLVKSRCKGVLEGRDMAVVDSLRRMSKAYPQDPQVWYNLGESLFHAWVPGGWRESEQAFHRATKLDSGAAPYQQHLNDIALSLHRDSVRAIGQIRRYPEEHLRRMYEVFSTLIFGTRSDRQTAWSRLDTLSLPNTGFPYWVRWPFLHPKDLDLQERVLHKILQRRNIRKGPYMELLAENYLLRGKVEALRPLLENEANQKEAGCLLAVGTSLQYAVPDSLLQAHLKLSSVGTEASTNQLLCAGIYLIEQNRTEQLPELMTRLEGAIVDASETNEDAKNRLRVVSHELMGYRAWKAGRLKRAARLWSASKWSWWWWGGVTGALWRGDLYRELGKLQKAEEWYRAAWTHPVAHERLGRLYEEMGTPEKAQSAYRRFIEAWKDADPELQIRVDKARNRLHELEERAPMDEETSASHKA